MAPVYADHPFAVLNTPTFKLPKNVEPDIFHRIASEMTLVHNCILRGLNAIYLQAPHIRSKDEASFANHMLQWIRFLDGHHRGEERHFFPAVDSLTGTAGYMDVNIEQHKAFHRGIEEFSVCVKALVARSERYDGQKVVSLIDGFGEALYLHLRDEIPTILELKRFGADKIAPIEKVFAQEAQEAMGELGLLEGLPWAVTSLDNSFEAGVWVGKFPPDPMGRAIIGFCRYVTWWYHRDWWKFGACDGNGNMRPLYAFPDDGS